MVINLNIFCQGRPFKSIKSVDKQNNPMNNVEFIKDLNHNTIIHAKPTDLMELWSLTTPPLPRAIKKHFI